MRNTFIKELTKFVETDKNIIFMTADLGFSVFEEFMEKYPNNYINVGLAEQNLIGVAAGLALTGKKVFVYSIAPFATARCFEQIKVNIAYHNLDVIIVGVGGGFSYSKSGSTHHAFEDIGILRTLPNMKILCPGDPIEVKASVKYAIENSGPFYIRLGKNKEPNIHKEEVELKNIISISEGEDGIILTTGNMLELGTKIVEDLKNKHGKNFALSSCPIIKPFDEKQILDLLKKYKYIFSLEEHVKEGGLSSLLSEIIATSTYKDFLFKGFSIDHGFIKTVGSQDYLRDLSGISKDKITEQIIKILK
jgi:transketolase